MEPDLIDAELDKQIGLLKTANDTASQGRVLAVVTVLFSRCSADSHIAAAADVVPHIARLLASDDQVVQVKPCSNCAAGTTTASLHAEVCACMLSHKGPRALAGSYASLANQDRPRLHY